MPLENASHASVLASIAKGALFLSARVPEPLAWPGARWYALSDRWRPHGACVVAIGTFDGVHLGHRELIAQARADARRRGVPLVVVTFDPDPAQVLLGERERTQLLSTSDRILALAETGPDAIVVFDFDWDFSRIGHGEFITDHLLGMADVLAIHVGEDFSLGRGGEGTVSAMQVIAGALGIQVFGHELLERDGEPVTATRIRHELMGGAVREAADLMGRYPLVRGRVAHGRGQGASLGFPTANVLFSSRYAWPQEGVFCAIAAMGPMAYPAAVNLGLPPTFGDEPLAEGLSLAEACLLGFSGDLYDEDVSIILVERLRASRRFDSVSDLQATVRANLETVGKLLGEEGERVLS